MKIILITIAVTLALEYMTFDSLLTVVEREQYPKLSKHCYKYDDALICRIK